MSNTAELEIVEGIEVVGFDLDNTLYPQDPEVDAVILSYIYHECAELLGVTAEEAETLFQAHYKEGRGLTGGKSIKAMGVQTDRSIVQEALEHADVASVLKPDEFTLELIVMLRDRYRAVDILTGSDRKQTLGKLAALGFSLSDFGVVVTADELDKSNGDAYRYWLEVYSEFEPNQFLYIGDRLQVDSTIPAEMGIRTALINVEPDSEILVPQFRDIRAFGAHLLGQTL